MKLVQLILALYVTVLSALPCEALCFDEQVPLHSQTSAPIPDDCTDEERCSPFCQCATCPGFVVPAPFELTTDIGSTSPPLALLPVYISPNWPDVLGRIWQPPRLG